jgi:hypothetical protein
MARVAKPSSFRIRRDQRAFFVGKTGSGKTSLAKALLYGQNHVCILDPKRTFTLPERWPHTVYTTFGDVIAHKTPETLIYRPPLDEMKKGCDNFFFWAFDRQNTLVYVDEVISIVNGPRIFDGYETVLKMGRERNVGCWSATQRPASVPLAVMTESEHFFVFRLTNKDDRQRLSEWTGHNAIMRLPKEQHGFYYYGEETDRLVYYERANLGFLEKEQTHAKHESWSRAV